MSLAKGLQGSGEEDLALKAFVQKLAIAKTHPRVLLKDITEDFSAGANLESSNYWRYSNLPIANEDFRKAAEEWCFSELYEIAELSLSMPENLLIPFSNEYVFYLRFLKKPTGIIHPYRKYVAPTKWYKNAAMHEPHSHLWEVLALYSAQHEIFEETISLAALEEALFLVESYWNNDGGIDFLLAKGLIFFPFEDLLLFLKKVVLEKEKYPTWVWSLYLDDFKDFKDTPLGWWKSFRLTEELQETLKRTS